MNTIDPRRAQAMRVCTTLYRTATLPPVEPRLAAFLRICADKLADNPRVGAASLLDHALDALQSESAR